MPVFLLACLLWSVTLAATSNAGESPPAVVSKVAAKKAQKKSAAIPLAVDDWVEYKIHVPAAADPLQKSGLARPAPKTSLEEDSKSQTVYCRLSVKNQEDGALNLEIKIIDAMAPQRITIQTVPLSARNLELLSWQERFAKTKPPARAKTAPEEKFIYYNGSIMVSTRLIPSGVDNSEADSNPGGEIKEQKKIPFGIAYLKTGNGFSLRMLGFGRKQKESARPAFPLTNKTPVKKSSAKKTPQ